MVSDTGNVLQKKANKQLLLYLTYYKQSNSVKPFRNSRKTTSYTEYKQLVKNYQFLSNISWWCFWIMARSETKTPEQHIHSTKLLFHYDNGDCCEPNYATTY